MLFKLLKLLKLDKAANTCFEVLSHPFLFVELLFERPFEILLWHGQCKNTSNPLLKTCGDRDASGCAHSRLKGSPSCFSKLL